MRDDIVIVLEQIVKDLIHHHGTSKAVALKIGVEESSFSRKLTGQIGWTPTEIAAILSEGGYSLIKSDELSALRIFALKGLKGET